MTIEDGIFNSNAIVLGGYSYEGKAGKSGITSEALKKIREEIYGIV